MSKKEEYRKANEAFMASVSKKEGVVTLPDGVCYEVLAAGNGSGVVGDRSVVTCHYRGSLIDGKVFDDSWKRGCPEAFRVNELISGFSSALKRMHVGDHWKIYIPWELGYGKRPDGDIPGCSTLVFEVQLLVIHI